MKAKILIITLILFFLSCDHGLKPSEREILPEYEEPGFGGTVYFKGGWPDSIYDLRVVAFRKYPPQDIINEVLQGKAKFSETLPQRVDSTKYEVPADTGKWEYVVVALRYGSNIYSDWKAVGVYDTTPGDTIPTPIYIPYGKFLKGINITCDFDNPPPQPFKLAEILGFLLTNKKF